MYLINDCYEQFDLYNISDYTYREKNVIWIYRFVLF